MAGLFTLQTSRIRIAAHGMKVQYGPFASTYNVGGNVQMK
ncbi:hypothetical protein SAMN04488032_12035 [Pacificibacter marinus]|uniref:Uncharacterized protein n=1 Tax=Pacificibacter marinus TaxID=658057 RepID=A0A1Y5TQP5_9RHOB|nr:hypothetical protein SAMN04488032_12035 [Pacificibacter marinus]SLN69632.1 hypothetical protein PAM7971_03727 [Pacificibacter marinus]